MRYPRWNSPEQVLPQKILPVLETRLSLLVKEHPHCVQMKVGITALKEMVVLLVYLVVHSNPQQEITPVYQVAPSVWNAIASSQPLVNPSMQQLWPMPAEEMLSALESQEQTLAANGVPDSVITAYIRMAPLLAENEAISAYINATGNTSLRSALPEVLNAPEAVTIATQDQPLSESEQSKLLAMLLPLEPESSLNV